MFPVIRVIVFNERTLDKEKNPQTTFLSHMVQCGTLLEDLLTRNICSSNSTDNIVLQIMVAEGFTDWEDLVRDNYQYTMITEHLNKDIY